LAAEQQREQAQSAQEPQEQAPVLAEVRVSEEVEGVQSAPEEAVAVPAWVAEEGQVLVQAEAEVRVSEEEVAEVPAWVRAAEGQA